MNPLNLKLFGNRRCDVTLPPPSSSSLPLFSPRSPCPAPAPPIAGEVHVVFQDLVLKHPDDQPHLLRAKEVAAAALPAGPARVRETAACLMAASLGVRQQARGREPVARCSLSLALCPQKIYLNGPHNVIYDQLARSHLSGPKNPCGKTRDQRHAPGGGICYRPFGQWLDRVRDTPELPQINS